MTMNGTTRGISTTVLPPAMSLVNPRIFTIMLTECMIAGTVWTDLILPYWRRIVRYILSWLLTLSVCFGLVTDSPPPVQPDPLTQLARALPDWSQHPVIGSTVKKVLHRLRAYAEWRYQAEIVADPDSMKIIVIGQTHMSPYMRPGYRRNVLISQNNVYRLLQRHAPDVVSLEGWDKDTLFLTALLPTYAKKSRASTLAEEGAVRYLNQHRHLQAVGAEDSILYALGRDIWGLIYTPHIVSQERFESLFRLQFCIVDARSQIAIDRTVIAMHHRRRQRAALVIGKLHKESCLQEIRLLGLAIHYHAASGKKASIRR